MIDNGKQTPLTIERGVTRSGSGAAFSTRHRCDRDKKREMSFHRYLMLRRLHAVHYFISAKRQIYVSCIIEQDVWRGESWADMGSHVNLVPTTAT